LGVAVVPLPSPVADADGVLVDGVLVDGVLVDGVLVDDASAAWSPTAMTPTKALPTATLTPAARRRPCTLKLRRAMWELSRRQVRAG
jgi:hypothetical protein